MNLKRTNDIPLTSEYLLVVLGDLSTRIQRYFGSMAPVNLAIHGGAVMVLHSELETRQYTLDIDYCHRGFVAEWETRGLCDAAARLQKCITETAEKFDLGADWMNAHADVVLPYTQNPKTMRVHDHVWHATMEKRNVEENTIYSSPGLNLVAVPWVWGVALKLVRYKKHDPYDIACILARGKRIRAVQHWDLHVIEKWLHSCDLMMGHSRYAPEQLYQRRKRIQHAIDFAQKIEAYGKARSKQLYHQEAMGGTSPQVVRVH